MRAVFLGPPGSGKGTLASTIAARHHTVRIATGDLLREHVAAKTPLGEQAADHMRAGRLVPDDLVIAMVCDRLKAEDAQDGFIFDGFPRTIDQAQALDRKLAEAGTALDLAINLNVPDDELIRRVTSRRICTSCGAIYNLESCPPKVAGRCDRCGHALSQRNDDNAEAMETRLDVYRKQAAPLIAYYDERGLLIEVDNTQPVARVLETLERALAKALDL